MQFKYSLKPLSNYKPIKKNFSYDLFKLIHKILLINILKNLQNGAYSYVIDFRKFQAKIKKELRITKTRK